VKNPELAYAGIAVAAIIAIRWVHLPASKANAVNMKVGNVSIGMGEVEAPAANQYGYHFHPSPAGVCIKRYWPDQGMGIQAKVNKKGRAPIG
jgi:hypothetical protein